VGYNNEESTLNLDDRMNGSASTEPESSREPDSPTSTGPVKSASVKTFQDFVKYAYAKGGQRVAFPRQIAKRVAANLVMDEETRKELVRWAAGDLQFRVPWSMLAAVARADVPRSVVIKTIEITILAVRVHPLHTEAPRGVGPSPPSGSASEAPEPTKSEARRALAKLLECLDESAQGAVDASAERAQAAFRALFLLAEVNLKLGPTADLSARDLATLKSNLIRTGVLAIALLQNWSLSQTTNILHLYLWQPSEQQGLNPYVLLTDEQDTATLSLVMESHASSLKDAETEVQRLQADLADQARVATEQHDGLARVNKSLIADVAMLGARVEELRCALGESERRMKERQTHASYDFETLRTQAIKHAKGAMVLLEDGLHALRRPEPKLHVTQDRLERTIAGLAKELSELTKGGKE
jgi:hypothetical protein